MADHWSNFRYRHSDPCEYPDKLYLSRN